MPLDPAPVVLSARARVRARLAHRIRAIELGRGGRAAGVVSTGWGAVDGELGGGLARGVLHEWCGLEAGRGWTPPLSLLVHLAGRALGAGDERGWVLWIGRALWPYPRALAGDWTVAQRSGHDAAPVLELPHFDRRVAQGAPRLLARSLFVDPPDSASRLWAIDASLRCPSLRAVVADGSGLRMAATRRLQLAAESGTALALLARPASEVRELSAAATRWRVRRAVTSTNRDDAERPGWTLELLRCRSTLR